MRDALTRENSPPGRVVLLSQIYLLLGTFAVAALYAGHKLIQNRTNLAFVLAGAFTVFLVAFIGGTPLALSLYFGTTFGAELRFQALPISVNRAVAVILFLAVMFEFKSMRLRLPFSMTLFLWLLFQVYHISLAFIKHPPDAPYPFDAMFYLFVFFLIAAQYWREQWMRWFVRGLILMSHVTLTLPGLLEFLLRREITVAGIGPFLGRVSGISSNAIFYSYVISWAIPFAMTMFIESRNAFSRGYYLGSVFLFGFCAMAGLNRQTPILLAAMFVVYVAMVQFPYRRLLIIGAVLGGLMLAPTMGAKIAERLSTTSDFRKDPSLAVRRDKLIVAREMVRENFWSGIGHNYYTDVFSEYKPVGKLYIIPYIWQRNFKPDMGYVQLLVEYGIVGASMVGCLLIAVFFRLRRYYRMSRLLGDRWSANMLAAVAAVFAQLVVGMLIQDVFATPRVYFQFGILIAVCTLVQCRVDERGEQEAAA